MTRNAQGQHFLSSSPRFRKSTVLGIVLGIPLLGFLLVAAAQAAIFTVNSPLDDVDVNPGNGICATSGGLCTLRAAIQEANALAGADEIILPPLPPPNGYVLSILEELTITGNLTITGGGPSNTIIDGNSSARPGRRVIGSTGIVNISGVTIRNGGSSRSLTTLAVPVGAGIHNLGTMTVTNSTVTGNTVDTPVVFCTDCGGGGIYNSGTLTLFDSTVSRNIVLLVADICSSCGGGGIYNKGTLTLVNTTVSGNDAARLSGTTINYGYGGGIYNHTAGALTLINSTVGNGNSANFGGGISNNGIMTVVSSTVSENTALIDGGGIDNSGISGPGGAPPPISSFARLTLVNSTVSGNSAIAGGGGINNLDYSVVNVLNGTITNNQADAFFNGNGIGGGVRVAGGTVTLQNTILAGNVETRFNVLLGLWVTTFRDCAGTVVSSGNNLMRNVVNCDVKDIPPMVADPLLGPLQSNGGPTRTHALLAGSPAIDGGNSDGCRDRFGVLLTTDQRGFPRPVDGNNDNVATCDIGAYELFTGSNTSVVAALLPSSRSVQVGAPATAFATMINTGQGIAAGCSTAVLSNVPGTFQYQTTDPTTNQVTGFPNTPADISAGAAQSFVFAITPTAPLAPTDVQFSFHCANSDPAPINTGLNTLLLSVSNTPVPDIVALAATTSSDGIVNISGTNGTGAFAVATVNVGTSGSITASADTGAATLPVNISVCQTDPANGQCISSVGPTVTTTINANATPTFGIFVQGNGDVPFDPAANRIFVRFKDGGGVTRGSTSVAVRTQ